MAAPTNAALAKIDGADQLLEPNLAQAVAVTIHELATNAAKYGALSTSNGRVTIAWAPNADANLVLSWIETGGPPVTPPKRQGFGTRVIPNLIRQIRGQMQLDWRRDGLVCKIILPVASEELPPATLT
jgi:two-component sensor histidine kinase